MNKESPAFSRGQLASSTGVKAETIRYYEERGLLAPPARSAGGHRIYSKDHEIALNFIRRCRELGFTLDEITGLLQLARKDDIPCQQVRQVTATHLVDVRNKIRDLRRMEKTLKNLVEQCDTNTSPGCPLFEILMFRPH